MKNFNFLILILIVTNSYSQFFAPENSTWHTYFYWTGNNGPGSQFTSHNHVYLELTGDTIVQNDTLQHVHVVYEEGVPNPDTTAFDGYFLKDSNRIFFGTDINSLELYYDFNLTIGDSFIQKVGYGTDWGTDTVYVNNVDTVVLNGVARRRLTFNDFSYYSEDFNTLIEEESMVWVEGIGDIKYGLVPYDFKYNFYSHWQLECFKENETTVAGSCSSTVSISNDDIFNISIYPNPANKFISVDMDQNSQYNIDVYDCFGSHIIQQNYTIGSTQLNIETLNAGIYFIVITKGSMTITKKFVKN